MRLEAGEKRISEYIFPFEKLDVWRMAVDLAETVLSFLEELPPNKDVRLIGQMESAAVSVSQNIAEGEGRQHKKEFIQFLHIAKGSIVEVVTFDGAREIRSRCEQVDRKLNGLINSLRGKKKNWSGRETKDKESGYEQLGG